MSDDSSIFGSRETRRIRKKATIAKSLSEWIAVSVSSLEKSEAVNKNIFGRTHNVMRRLKRGQSRFSVSYSPPSPQMCEPYKVFYCRLINFW